MVGCASQRGSDDASTDSGAASDGEADHGGSGQDALATLDAGPRAFCATRAPAPFWCEDFDVAAFDTTAGDVTDGSSIAVDDRAFFSAPHALDTRVVSAPVQYYPHARALRYATGVPTEELSLEVMLQAVSWDPGARCGVLAILSRKSTHYVEVWLGSDKDLFSSHTSLRDEYQDLTKRIPRGDSWVSVKLVVTLTGATPHVRVEVDHEPALDHDVGQMLDLEDPTFYVGATHLVVPSNPWLLRVDDVAAYAKFL
jgi:hypothetical protein